VPDLRDIYWTRHYVSDYSDREGQEEFVRDKEGGTDPRYARAQAEKSHRYNEEFDGTNALQLKSSSEKLIFNLSLLVILLSTYIM